MNILISGASGLVGRHLTPLLRASGHSVTRLVRREAKSGEERTWNPDRGELDPAVFAGVDAVVNLSGDNIGEGRWTAAKKQRILDSRVKTTQLLSETMVKASRLPAAFVSASAIGIYGHRGDEVLTESSEAGRGFLVDVCRQWEAATEPARVGRVRVVNLRLGVIMSPEGGALQKMLLPFKLGVGGVIGSGKQYWSWLTVEEACRIILFAAKQTGLSGPVNAVSPQAVTNKEFTQTMGKVLKRPTFVPMPAFAARLALGEMADDLMLASARVSPEKLIAAGYAFHDPELRAALERVLKTS